LAAAVELEAVPPPASTGTTPTLQRRWKRGGDGGGGRGCSAGVHCARVETRARHAGGPAVCASGTATPKAGRATAS